MGLSLGLIQSSSCRWAWGNLNLLLIFPYKEGATDDEICTLTNPIIVNELRDIIIDINFRFYVRKLYLYYLV